ncbi:hypothetical protein SARC_07433, partial [Sphaeroforma arctica JP610]
SVHQISVAMAENNLNRTDNFFTNERGIRLHVRQFHPRHQPSTGVFFFYHGYAAHSNRKAFVKFGEKLVEESGMSVVLMDHESHGYSGPEGRLEDVSAMVRSYQHLVDDCLQLIQLVRCGSEALNRYEEEGVCKLGFSAEQADHLASIPFYISGQSMGGGIAVMVGLHIQDTLKQLVTSRTADPGAKATDTTDIASEKTLHAGVSDVHPPTTTSTQLAHAHVFDGYAGAVFVAPALGVGGRPPYVLELLMTCVIAKTLPTWSLPTFLDTTAVDSDIWVSEEIAELYSRDPLRFPNPIRWCTAASIIAMADAISPRMGDVSYPFLVVHDPEDKICQFAKSEELLQKASTSEHQKKVHRMVGMRHDIVTNCGEDLAVIIAAWTKELESK